MTSLEIVDLSSDDEVEVEVRPIYIDRNRVGVGMQENDNKYSALKQQKPKIQFMRDASEEIRSSNGSTALRSSNGVLESPASSTSPNISEAPLCRQFWKAGNCDDGQVSRATVQRGKNYLHVHPLFLHSNATSHKWAFGAMAELLDNAVDEIQNGATFVIVDKTTNPRDGSPALLIQDDGGGMNPEAMRHCMSFGFSEKKSKFVIGKYGNGFKTSAMRLGADVIVFSRHIDSRTLTQSVGLLSYTFLTRTGHDRIVVPMVDYEFNASSGSLEKWHCYGREHFMSNLGILLQWSPYSTEAELLKQFDDIDRHGTKIVIYNLWHNDDGNLELDFNSDPEDICLVGDTIKVGMVPTARTSKEQHIANRYHYSLRVYSSILYMRVPESFRIVLRGRVVEHHNLAADLKFQEFIMYRPQSGGCVEGSVVTTIGFVKEAPRINVHGFNVYHKNRLILPFWQVVNSSNSRGRGVVGVLEANFVEPTHNKQDFERTSLFQKLENRLKEMTLEYWDYHCGLIGYQAPKRKTSPSLTHASTPHPQCGGVQQPVILETRLPAAATVREASTGGALKQSIDIGKFNSMGRSEQGLHMKRKERAVIVETESVKRHAGKVGPPVNAEGTCRLQPINTAAYQPENQEVTILLRENKKLHAQCLEFEKTEEHLNLKVAKLRSELEEVQQEYTRILVELQSLDVIKEEKYVNM